MALLNHYIFVDVWAIKAVFLAYTRVRDASGNPFVRHEQKIEATARPANWRDTPKK